MPKCSKNDIHTYSDVECGRILKAAREFVHDANDDRAFRWDLLIVAALCTGLRRAELLNSTWSDVHFEEQTITVTPKDERPETWLWLIKDTDRRTLPLTDELAQMLAEHQDRQPEGYPYVFVPSDRYDFIQRQLRVKGLWTYSDSRLKVMRFAGHASFGTTHRYYLRIRDGLVDRARQASARVLSRNLARAWRAPCFALTKKRAGKRKYLSALSLHQWAGVDLNHRHTDFQSAARLVTSLLAMTYKRFFCGTNEGFKWLTSE